MPSPVDLRELAVEHAPTASSRRRPRILSRFFVPGIVIVGFVGLVGTSLYEQFRPTRNVTVVPVIVARAEIQRSGEALFQAPGWVEPRPTPVLATALAEGVVQDLLVVEGQSVRKGEPIARLIEIDARLELERAESELELNQAEVARAEAAVRAARLRLEHPVHLEAQAAEAESLLAQKETELSQLPFLSQSAAARTEYARQNLAGRTSAGAAIAGRLVQEAQAEYDALVAEQQELEARGPSLRREVDALRRKSEALARQLKLLIDESRAVADAEASLKSAQARRALSELAVQGAELRLARMTIHAPIDGRVLSLIARPGTRLMGLSSASAHDSSAVVSLYDPHRLQVRADVRLEDVPHVQPGQPVRVETASAAGPIAGTVLSATSAANIQKNTLEVKVALNDPPASLRPEMLVTTTFLAPERPESNADLSESAERLLVPESLVEGTGENGAVWIVAPEGTARKRRIRRGGKVAGGLVEVVEGLYPTDRLIAGGREGLEEGDRIVITGEDETLGAEVPLPEE